MMAYIFGGMILLSLIFGIGTGRIEQVSNAAMSEAGEAVMLCLKLMGMMCLWSGLMKVADRAGITDRISRLFSPVTRWLFKGVKPGSAALKAISMNITANLLGLGNAATPLGITAMQELQKESNLNGIATNDMVLFVVLNTASIQILPTTTAMLRLAHGSAAPLEILPAVWMTSIVSVLSAIGMAKLLGALRPEKGERI